jgi:4-oxalocrotonate tautomerase
MPFIHIQVAPAPGISADADTLARALTGLAEHVLRKKRELTAVRVEAVDPAAWFIGARPLTSPPRSTAHVSIQVTAGTNTADEKARFVVAVFDELSTLLGGLDAASYVVVQEIAAEAWGYGGRTQAARQPAATAAVR